LAGVEVPTKHVERAAEALGREIAEDEMSGRFEQFWERRVQRRVA